MPKKPWKVEENTLGGWEDNWTEEDLKTGEVKPLRFRTRAEAGAEIKTLIKDCRQAKMSGYRLENFRVVRA